MEKTMKKSVSGTVKNFKDPEKRMEQLEKAELAKEELRQKRKDELAEKAKEEKPNDMSFVKDQIQQMANGYVTSSRRKKELKEEEILPDIIEPEFEIE